MYIYNYAIIRGGSPTMHVYTRGYEGCCLIGIENENNLF